MGRLVRALSADGSVLCSALDSRDMVNEIIKIHNSSPVASAALGRLASGASIMGALMKNEQDTMTLRIKGDGPAGMLVAVSDYMGNVKCYAGNPFADLPLKPNGKLDVSGYVGKNGFLSVVRDMGLKEPYAAQIPLVSGEIAEDITSYFAVSEQIPTVMALGVLIDTDCSAKAAGGYLVQLLPPVNEAAIDIIEENIKSMQSVTAMFAGGMSPEDIVFRALKGFSPEILDSWDAAYYCGCSRERTEGMLLCLSREDLADLGKDEKGAEVCCNFCGKKYHFTKNQLSELIEKNKAK